MISRRNLFLLVIGLCVTSISFSANSYNPRITASLNSCESFISHSEIGQQLADWETQYPNMVDVFNVGNSVEGRELFAIRITSDIATPAPKPAARIIGSIHGNECVAATMVMEITGWLLENYGSDSDVTQFVDEASITLVPLVNPDGYTGQWADRYNANDVDLNRNFGIGWIESGGWGGNETGDYPYSEPETRAIRDMEGNFSLGLSYHTIANYINGPWNYTPHHPPDDDLLWDMGTAYKGSSSYNVTFGWDWFGIYGDVNDWALGTNGCFDWTIEMRDEYEDTGESAIHLAGVRGFLTFLFTGIRGVVTDDSTGDVIPARIELLNPEGSPVFNGEAFGAYYRVLNPGTYDIRVSSPGYVSETATGVSVTAGAHTVRDFSLTAADSDEPAYAFRVVETQLPDAIENGTNSYHNDSLPWYALGAPDGTGYSVSPDGSITVDMGEETLVSDISGAELLIVSSTGSGDPADVYVAEDLDGPYEKVADGSGDIEADISSSGFSEIRYVRVVDRGNGSFSEELAGYDLDAVTQIRDGSGTTDSDSDSDTDGDSDSDADSDTDTSADGGTDGLGAESSGCGCRVSGTAPDSLFSVLVRIIV